MIDTHQTYKELLEAGVPERQADVQARMFGRWTEEKIVTREYLDLKLNAAKSEIEARFSDVDARFSDVDRRMAEIEKRLTHRMLTIAGASVGLLGTLMTVLNFFG